MLHRSTLVHHRLPHSMDPVSAVFMSFPSKISGPAHPHSKHPTIMDEELMVNGYQQHVIHLVDDVADDNFEPCFGPVSICSIKLLGIDTSCPASMEAMPVLPVLIQDPILLCCHAVTYDADSSLSVAHADNGLMANTVNDAALLFAYRPLKDSKVCLLDTGDHAHHPLGVCFLCIPTTHCGIAGAPMSVFIRAYHTPTIPGIIISHSSVTTC